MTADEVNSSKLYALLHRDELMSELLSSQRPKDFNQILLLSSGLDTAALQAGIARINSVALVPLNGEFYKLWEPYKYNSAENALVWMPAHEMTDSAFFSEHLVKLGGGLAKSMIRPKVALSSIQPEWTGDSQQSVNIFHLSRCGSTLLARAFYLLANSRVLSESPVLTEFLLNGHQTAPDRQHYLKLLVRLQGRLAGQERQLVIKWNCWDLAYGAEIIQSSPEARHIFLLRHPEEILASHLLNGAGRHMVPASTSPSGRPFQWGENLLSWRIEVLKHQMSQMLQLIESDKAGVLVLDYADLSADTLLDITGVNPDWMTPVEQQNLARLLHENVKMPLQKFKADATKKRRFFGQSDRQQIEVLLPIYEQLRQYRTVRL